MKQDISAGRSRSHKTLSGGTRLHTTITVGLICALVVEGVTIACGLLYKGSGPEFADAHNFPVILRIHHGVWGLLLMLVALAFLGRPQVFAWVMGIGLGLFFSDAVHHLVVAPLIYGETRWHWP
jgi:hypothetical protein